MKKFLMVYELKKEYHFVHVLSNEGYGFFSLLFYNKRKNEGGGLKIHDNTETLRKSACAA